MGNWEKKKFKDAIEVIRNGTSDKQIQSITPFPVTRIETISEGKIDFGRIGYIEKSTSKYLLQNEDILFSNINSVKHIGKVAFYQEERELYHGMNLLLFRFKENYDKKFLFYYLIFSKKWFEKMAAQAINQASINQTVIDDFIFNIPSSKAEQIAIARILSEADAAIADTEALIAKYQRIKTGLMQDLLTCGIDEQGNIRSKKTHTFVMKNGVEVPAEWEVKEIENIYNSIKSGSTPLRENSSYFEEGNILWVKTLDLNESFVCQTEENITKKALQETSCNLFPINSVLIAMYGGWEQIGRTAILSKEATTNQAITALFNAKFFILPEYHAKISGSACLRRYLFLVELIVLRRTENRVSK